MRPLATCVAAFWLTIAVGQSCGGNPEVVRAPLSACDAGACPMPDGGAKTAGSFPAPPDDALPPPDPPSFGALLVVLKTADGVEHAILCGGEVSSDLGKPRASACPYDHDGDAGRGLLKLDRGEP